MHEMQQTPKIITIIGLVLEGLAGFALVLTTLLFSNIENIPRYSESLLEMTPEEFEAYEYLMGFIMGALTIFAVVISTMFIINLFLFSKLIKGRYTEEQARKVYLYQAIWGGINVLTNSVTGILYLVSGIQGYNGEVDRIETREGI